MLLNNTRKQFFFHESKGFIFYSLLKRNFLVNAVENISPKRRDHLSKGKVFNI
jgi:hypothetical protein